MNAVAPEHLEVQLPDAISYLNQIQNAGSVFLGFSASEPVGDYIAGPNHILPTGGTARFFSPLGVQDFVKRTQFVSYTRPALKKEAEAITTLARVEAWRRTQERSRVGLISVRSKVVNTRSIRDQSEKSKLGISRFDALCAGC